MFLEKYRKAYYEGNPLISDEHYDALAEIYGEGDGLGGEGDIPHLFQMYSLQKIFDEDDIPTTCRGDLLIRSPKLDGSAISLMYEDGYLIQGSTRGDGIVGKDISDKVLLMDSIPKSIDRKGQVMISGEVVTSKDAHNARNTAAGAFGLKDLVEFQKRELYFVAYSIQPSKNGYYTDDMEYLHDQGFETIMHVPFDKYRTDGEVFRINDNTKFSKLGYTAKHPRGAYAKKKKSDVQIKETELLDVQWQLGASGKVTPVAIINEIVIDDAKINRVTLHNVGYVEDLDLDIGDTVLITRSGSIIPKILGNKTKEILLYL